MPVYQAIVIRNAKYFGVVFEVTAENETAAVEIIDAKFRDIEQISADFKAEFGKFVTADNHGLAQVIETASEWRAQGRPIRQRVE